MGQRAQYAEALLQMAGVSCDRGNHLQARAFLQRYLAVTQGGPDVLLLGYQVERALGDQPAADDFARRLRTQFPDSPEARILATTHWGALTLLAEVGPTIRVEPHPRVVEDGIITSAGVSAGIDMALAVVESLCGSSVADETAHYMDYPRTIRAGSPLP